MTMELTNNENAFVYDPKNGAAVTIAVKDDKIVITVQDLEVVISPLGLTNPIPGDEVCSIPLIPEAGYRIDTEAKVG